MGEQVLDVRGVRRTFEAENAPVRALRGADFSMDHGEFEGAHGSYDVARPTDARDTTASCATPPTASRATWPASRSGFTQTRGRR